MSGKNNNVLLNDRDRQIVAAISNLVKVVDEGISEFGMMRIDQIPEDVCERINTTHDEFIELLGFKADDPMADIKVFIETVDLFHRAVPRTVVEEVWAGILGPMAMMTVMSGGMTPIVLCESMHRLISQLKIDADGWVEGLKGEA
jgi:hypothetical protein